MSVASLIDQFGKTVSIVRNTMTKDATGGPSVASTASTSAVMFLQVLGGGTSRRYGGERNQYDCTGYAYPETDITHSDFVTFTDDDGRVRRYRVESVRNPDERSLGDQLAYRIVGLQEDAVAT